MAIVVDPVLESALDEIAELLERPAQEIAGDAIRNHLDYLRREQLALEAQAYQRLHPGLVAQNLHQFVAIRDGGLVDSDADFERLFLRLQERFGTLPVLIRQVQMTADEEWHFRSPRMESF